MVYNFNINGIPLLITRGFEVFCDFSSFAASNANLLFASTGLAKQGLVEMLHTMPINKQYVTDPVNKFILVEWILG